jgi:hypothetical protein
MNEYLRYASLSQENLVDYFVNNFLKVDDSATRGRLFDILNNIASRDVGRLEIELLATKMSVHRIFWNRVISEVNYRKQRLRSAVRSFDVDNDETIGELLCASYLVSNLLRFFANPYEPSSITSEIFETFGTASSFLHKFFLCEEELISGFFKSLDSEAPWDKSMVDSILIDMGSGGIPGVCELLSNISLIALRAVGNSASEISGFLSVICFVNGDKNMFRRGSTRTASSWALININFDAYVSSGIARQGGHYCYTKKYYEATKKRNVGCQQKNVYGSVFHELDQCFTLV